eukprot:1809795-Rhodomonas_salina.1
MYSKPKVAKQQASRASRCTHQMRTSWLHTWTSSSTKHRHHHQHDSVTPERDAQAHSRHKS